MEPRRVVRVLSVFLDTNVLVYAHDRADRDKQAAALAILGGGDWTISTQVLQEFFVVVTRRLAVPIAPATALAILDDLSDAPVIATDARLVRAAAAMSVAHQLSFWDAMILEAATRGGCATLLTEDLNAGQTIGGVTIVNPFIA